jgi:hypothetical protein
MPSAALQSKVVSLRDGQARVAAWMDNLGIDVEASIWVYPKSSAQQYASLATRRIDWGQFLVPLS